MKTYPHGHFPKTIDAIRARNLPLLETQFHSSVADALVLCDRVEELENDAKNATPRLIFRERDAMIELCEALRARCRELEAALAHERQK